MNDLPATMEQLALRVQQLELRVQLLESLSVQPTADHPAVPLQQPTPLSLTPEPDTAPPPALAPSATGGRFPVIGKALLGIGGAYVLRALAESGAIPTSILVVIAFVYACAWLVMATRTAGEDWFASSTYACTSALILAPMLWELTLRFQVLPAWAGATLLTGFALSASALGWKRNLASVVWIANLTGVLTALTLMLATHTVVPFLWAMLVMALASEYAADLGHWPGVRAVVALSTDLALALAAFIYSGPANRHQDYPDLPAASLVAPAVTLFLIYSISQAIGTLIQRKTITLMGMSQSMLAFALAAITLAQFGGPAGVTSLGLACIALAAFCYPVAFLRFRNLPEPRNFHVFATWSPALLVCALVLLLPAAIQAPLLAAVALATMLLARRLGALTLRFHAVAILAVAAITSGFASAFGQAIFGTLATSGIALPFTIAAASLLLYALTGPSLPDRWFRRTPWVLSAAFAVAAVSLFAVQGLILAASLAILPDVSHIAVIRTLTLCLITLALAFSGARFSRAELVWMAWTLLGLVGIKLLVEDLRHGHAVYTAISISLFALTLILLPRLVRLGQKA